MKILHVKIRNDHLLVASLESIQTAVRVFFEQVEISGVIFPAVRVEISKHAHARLFMDKNEPAKIAGKALNPRAHGKEIVIGAQIANLVLRERFLKPGVRFEARGAAAHIHVHYAQLAHVQIIHIHGGRHSDSPVNRTE